jgi:hypothetical protein
MSDDEFGAFWHAHSARSRMRHELVRYDDLVEALHRDVASSVNSVTVKRNQAMRFDLNVLILVLG